MVNELLIASGRSLDKITQAETIESYPALSQDLGKLAASQYLAEMVMCQALSEQPQTELFCLLGEHLKRLEQLPKSSGFLTLAHLSQAVFHLLAIAGLTPQLQACCLTGQAIAPDFTSADWQVGFSNLAGGIVNLAAWESFQARGKNSYKTKPLQPPTTANSVDVKTPNGISPAGKVAEVQSNGYQTVVHRQEKLILDTSINATELALLQQLAGANLAQINTDSLDLADLPVLDIDTSWLSVERLLRQYVQYHFGRPIRSAALIDSYFATLPTFSIKDHATV